MAAKKETKLAKKLTKSYIPTKAQSEKARKEAEAEMKKHGFKTPQELIAYYDKQRGY